MQYEYDIERPKIFTEEGQVTFLKIRDQVNRHLKEAGAVRSDKALAGVTGNGWMHLACLDRMIELGELVRLSDDTVWAQYQIYTCEVKN